VVLAAGLRNYSLCLQTHNPHICWLTEVGWDRQTDPADLPAEAP